MKKKITVNLYKNNKLELSYKNINVLINNETYTFINEGIKMTLTDEVFIRENKEFKFVLDIKNKKSTYLLKEKNIVLDINVEKLYFKKGKESIIVEYKLESNEENIKMELIN